ncbi:MAG: hypothetical protein ACLQRH_08185 [Acidimicrobiales bacterium]
MDLQPHVDEIHRQLGTAAAAGGEDARALAERLLAPLDAAVRLTLLEVLAAAVQEITCELAPGSVEVRLRGRDPEFVISTPSDVAGDDQAGGTVPDVGSLAGDGGEMSRINLRLPDQLKVRVDQAAASEGLSANAWLVRAAAAALERADPPGRLDRRGPQGAQRFTGWARS